MKLAALLLAAGAARRFGSDKRTVAMPSGQTLLATTLANYLPLPLACTVVLDRDDQQLAEQVSAAGAQVVRVASQQAPLGMGDSLASGIREVARLEYDACLIALADMPWVSGDTLRGIIDALADHSIVVPEWQGRWGHPVGFSSRYFPELGCLSGDRGARTVLQRHAAERYVLSVQDAGVVRDIDIPADLAQH